MVGGSPPAYPAEQAAIWRRAEVREVIAQGLRQLRMSQDDPAVALCAVLELPLIALGSVIGPVAARVGRCVPLM
jgi:hypothetical protein